MTAIAIGLQPLFVLGDKFIVQILDVQITHLVSPTDKGFCVLERSLISFQN
jgi:hypothetical protein